jgi:hypothetical protein
MATSTSSAGRKKRGTKKESRGEQRFFFFHPFVTMKERKRKTEQKRGREKRIK